MSVISQNKLYTYSLHDVSNQCSRQSVSRLGIDVHRRPTYERYEFADFVLDPNNRLITRHGVEARCNSQTFDLLLLLITHGGNLVTRSMIRDELWKGRTIEYDQAINSCIREARKLLGDSIKAPLFIKTIPKHGYVFVCPVKYNRVNDDTLKLGLNEQTRRAQ